MLQNLIMRPFLNNNLVYTLALIGLSWLLAGCQSLNEPDTGNLASVEITGQPMSNVQAATTSVFTANSFTGGPIGPNEFSFMRPGSRMDQIAYGSYMFKRPVMVKVNVTTTQRTADVIVVACKAWLMEEDPDPVFQDSHKVGIFSRGTYEDLLQQVQQQAAGK